MNQSTKDGFTIVELMLAMGFVSVLLLSIALIVIQMANTYNKGITFKNVDQVGSTLSSDITQTIQQSSPFNTGNNFLYKYSNGVKAGGRLCLGQYSYVWNYGNSFRAPLSRPNVYAGSNTPIYFAKVNDPGAQYCVNPNLAIDSTRAVELINTGDLVLHYFNITRRAPSEPQGLYSIEMLIGTSDMTALTGSDISTQCRPPSDSQSDPIYCAVDQFNFVARTGVR